MNFKYEVNDLVGCLHNGHFYEARITDLKYDETGQHLYEIHYVGWNKSWDELVPLSHLKDISEIGVIVPGPKGKKKKNKAAFSLQNGKAKQSILVTSNLTKDEGNTSKDQTSPVLISEKTKEQFKDDTDPSSPAVILGKSSKKVGRKRVSKIPKIPEKVYVKYNKIDVPMPQELKLILFNDYINIVKKKMLVNMPVLKTVQVLLEEYLFDRCPSLKKDYTGSKEYISPFNFETIQLSEEFKGKFELLKKLNTDLLANTYFFSEFVKGMAWYFDLTLQTKLLYNFERTQLRDLINEIEVSFEDRESSQISDSESSSFSDASNSTSINHGASTSTSTSTSTNNEVTRYMQFSCHYGPVHFLRLLTKFPSLFAHYNADECLIKLFEFYIKDLQVYLNDHRHDLFTENDYTKAPSAYLDQTSVQTFIDHTNSFMAGAK